MLKKIAHLITYTLMLAGLMTHPSMAAKTSTVQTKTKVTGPKTTQLKKTTILIKKPVLAKKPGIIAPKINITKRPVLVKKPGIVAPKINVAKRPVLVKKPGIVAPKINVTKRPVLAKKPGIVAPKINVIKNQFPSHDRNTLMQNKINTTIQNQPIVLSPQEIEQDRLISQLAAKEKMIIEKIAPKNILLDVQDGKQ